MENTVTLGQKGEKKVAEFCRKEFEYEIVASNVKCAKFGEIDIVAKDKDIWVFIEVKTRYNDIYMPIYEQVNKRKSEALLRAANYYIAKKKLYKAGYRIDLATYNESLNEIKYYRNIVS